MRIRTLIFLLFAALPAAAAEPFDGSAAFQCTAIAGHDCLPDKRSCDRLKPERDEPPVLGFDVPNKQVRSPYRTSLLPIQQMSTNKDSLVLQGHDLQFAWTAVIHRTNGKMTVTIADRKGAYVIFGQCAAPAAGG